MRSVPPRRGCGAGCAVACGVLVGGADIAIGVETGTGAGVDATGVASVVGGLPTGGAPTPHAASSPTPVLEINSLSADRRPISLTTPFPPDACCRQAIRFTSSRSVVTPYHVV